MNIHHIISLNGYGIFVWPAYLITLLVFAINMLNTWHNKYKTIRTIKNYLKIKKLS